MLIRRVEVEDFAVLKDPVALDLGPGLNVVHGPNESGKSTLMRAMWNGLTLRSKTRGAKLNEMRPRDGGAPRVRICFEHEGKRYRIEKHFRGERGTTRLEISLSSGGGVLASGGGEFEELAGDEAEERLRAALGLDEDSGRRKAREHLGLWPLVWVDQGQGDLDPALDLTGPARGALDGRLRGLTGAVFAGAGAEGLASAAQREYERYFTARGAPKSSADSPLAGAREQLALAQSALDELERRRADHESTLERHLALERRERAVETAAVELGGAAERAARAFESVQSVRGRLETARAHLKLAHSEEQQLRERLTRRDSLLRRVEQATERLTQIEGRAAELEQNARAEGESRRALERELTAAQSRDRELSRTARALRAQLELARDRGALRRLQESLERAREYEGSLRDNRLRLADLELAQSDLEHLETLHEVAQKSRLALEVAAVSLKVELLSEVWLDIDGERQSLAAGESLERRLDERSTLELVRPGLEGKGSEAVARIELTPGGVDLAGLREAARTSAEALRDCLVDLDVSSLGEARRRVAERGRVEQTLRETERLFAIVAPEGLAALEAEARSLAHEREALELRGRVAGEALAPLPEDLDQARGLVAEHEREAAQAGEQRALLATELEGQVARVAKLERELSSVTSERSAGAERLAELREELQGLAGGEGEGAELERRASQEALRAAEITAEVNQLEAELAGLDEEQVEVEAERTAKALASTQGELEELSREMSASAALLSSAELCGLHERLDAARARAASSLSEVAGEERRSQAAKLLYETLDGCRSEARQTYLAPLRTATESLLRALFSGAAVEFDDAFALRHLHRAESGLDPFASLSGGAREQLGLVVRLAMAQVLCAEGETLPVLFDDALVATDEERFRRMANVLTLASRKLQIVLFTCHPDRYRALGVDRDQVHDLEQLKLLGRRAQSTTRPGQPTTG